MALDRVDAVVNLSKRRGFVYPSSEIYGGSRSAWDYGPLGVELKENVRRQWWRSMVQGRDDIVGLDSAVILAPQVWAASGHLEAFVDPLTECLSCHKRFREDHLIEAYENKHGRAPEGGLAGINCPHCGTCKGQWTEPRNFNVMFKTHLGPVQDDASVHYLRPETAQGIFVNFANVPAPRARSRRSASPRSASPSATRSRPATSSSAPASSSRWRWSSSSSPAPTRSGTSTGSTPAGTGTSTSACRPTTCACTSTRRRSSRTTPSARSTSSTSSTSAARSSPSSRASPTAPTSTSRPTARHSGVDLSYFDQEANERWFPYVIEPAAGAHSRGARLPARGLRRGRGAQRQGRRRQAHGHALRQAACPGEGRGAAALAQRRPHAEGEGPRGRAAPVVERRVRRRRAIGTPLPPPGRDRHAVLRHGRLRHPRGPGGDGSRPRHDGLRGPASRRPVRQARIRTSRVRCLALCTRRSRPRHQ